VAKTYIHFDKAKIFTQKIIFWLVNKEFDI